MEGMAIGLYPLFIPSFHSGRDGEGRDGVKVEGMGRKRAVERGKVARVRAMVLRAWAVR